MIDWAREHLERRGATLTGEPEIVHNYPWAQVARIPTDRGAMFVKTMVPVIGHEVGVTAALVRIRPDRVTPLIAHDVDRRFMLMEDAGERLRSMLERDRDIRRWQGILPRYAELQLAAAPHVDELLAAGAPDMRTRALPAAFEAAIANDELLTIAGPESSTPEDLAALRALVPRVREWSGALAGAIPETIQHDDLHDGQIFLKEGNLRFLDWGDANVSHPFHSVVVLERVVAHTFQLAPDAPALLRLRDEYLEPFTALASRARIDDALELALVLGRLVRALTWMRLVRALPLDQREGDAVPGWFALFLEAARARSRG